MLNFKREEDKEFMLIALKDNNWETDVNEESPYEDVKRAFSEMIEEFEFIDYNMYPNGRDHDAENFDD